MKKHIKAKNCANFASPMASATTNTVVNSVGIKCTAHCPGHGGCKEPTLIHHNEFILK